jgi:tetratricopeptide (TPR) repeat protein
VSFFGRLIANKRIRRAARRLGPDPSADNYVLLAREHVVAGNMQEVLRVCSEGLQMHGGHTELQRLGDRAEQIQLEQRVATLTEELKGSPRPALWRELCSVLLKSGRLESASEAAEDWYRSTRDPEALYFRAEVHAEHFFADKGSEDGKKAYLLAGDARREMGNDPRPLQLQLEVSSRCGAWQEARKCIAQLLEILPGDSSLEARFRSILTMCQNAKSLEICLKDVERKGRFVDED